MSENESHLRNRLLSGVKWTVALRIATQAVSWIVTIIIVRFLTPQDYGLNAMLEVPIEFLALFCTLGVEMALIQKSDITKEDISAVFGVLLLLNGIFFLMIYLGAPYVAHYYNEPKLTLLLQTVSIVFLLSPFRTIPNALLDRELNFKLRAQVDMTATIISSVISLGLAISGFGVWALIFGFIASYLLRTLILAYYNPWLIWPTFNILKVKGLLYYGGLMTLSGAIFVIAIRSVNLIAGPILGAELLGLYAVALEFATLPMSKIMPIINQVMFPAYSRLQNQPVLIRQYLLKSMQISALIIFPMTIGIACVSYDLVYVIFGEKWIPMVLPLALLAAITPLRMMAQVCNPALNAIGKTQIVIFINLIMLAMLSLGAYFASTYGLMGIVLTWAITAPCITIITLIYVRKLIRIPITNLINSIKPAIVSSLVMAPPILGINFSITREPDFMLFLIKISLGISLYLATIFVFYRPLLNEIHHNLSERAPKNQL